MQQDIDVKTLRTKLKITQHKLADILKVEVRIEHTSGNLAAHLAPANEKSNRRDDNYKCPGSPACAVTECDHYLAHIRQPGCFGGCFGVACCEPLPVVHFRSPRIVGVK